MATPVFEEELLDNYTDAELLAFIDDSPPITTTREEAVRILSPNLVAKPVSHYWDPLDEVYAMKAARSAGVNAPEVCRVTRPDGLDDSWIIMERVRGLTVEQLWPNIGLWSTLCIAWKLRSAIRTFSSITSQTTGGLHSGKARSEWLEGRYGPARHATPDVFASYINWWLVNVPAWKPNPRPALFLSPSREHVLVHQDLVPRNLIVDADGKLWVIDWNRAGFYPAFMEVMGMDIQTRAMPWICEDTWAAWWGRLRWSLLRFIACGFTGKYKKAFSAMHVVSQRSLVYRLEKSPYSEQ